MLDQLIEEILLKIKIEYNNSTLSEQINNVKIVKKEYTGVGYFVYFEIEENIPKLNNNVPDVINGPNIISSNIENGGGCVIFQKNGYIELLELYAFGNYFEEKLNNFKLKF